MIKCENCETVACMYCGTQTPMTGTKKCDRCWELDSRIRRNPELARIIFERVYAEREQS